MRVPLSFLLVSLCVTLIHLGNAWGRGPLQYAGFLGLLAAGGLLVAWAFADWSTLATSPAQRGAAAAVLVLYAVSCLTPAVSVDEGGQPSSDLDFRIGSPLGIAVLGMGATFGWWLPWSANLLLPLGMSLLARRRLALASLAGAVAAAAALSSWWEGQRLLVGYYLWQASFLVLAIGPVVVVLESWGGRRRDSGGVPNKQPVTMATEPECP